MDSYCGLLFYSTGYSHGWLQIFWTKIRVNCRILNFSQLRPKILGNFFSKILCLPTWSSSVITQNISMKLNCLISIKCYFMHFFGETTWSGIRWLYLLEIEYTFFCFPTFLQYTNFQLNSPPTWKWSQYVPPKRLYLSSRQRNVITQ